MAGVVQYKSVYYNAWYSFYIDHNTQGGSSVSQTGNSLSSNSASVTVNTAVSTTVPTKTGYTFAGWNSKADGSGTNHSAGSNISHMFSRTASVDHTETSSDGTLVTTYYSCQDKNASTTIYAQWTRKTYTVSYNKGSNGTGTNTSDTKTHGTALTLKGAIFTRTGYTQTGWSTSDGGAKVYNLSASYTTEAAVTLYPFWTANTYTITYNKGSYGTGSQVTDTKTHGVALTLRGATFTRSNYSQDGWSVNQNGSTKDYNLSGSYTANSATTLYPHWKADTYTVSYNANGGSGAPAAQTKTYGVSLTLSSTAPTRTNYIFQGWATSSTGAVAYQPGGTYTANAAVTLYAIWQAAKSTLSTITSSVNIGSSGTAGWNIVNSAYTYKLVITYSNAPSVTVNVAANTSSASFTIPTTWYSYLSNVTSVTATATLTTYSGSASVGSTTKTFTVAVASTVKPTISSFTHSPYAQNSVVSGWGIYVQGYSQVDLSVSATAGTGASIVSIAFSGTGVSQSSTATTARSSVLTNTGYIGYSVTVTDSRGRTATSSLTGTARPYFYEYAPPVVSSMTAFRCNSSGTEDAIAGTYIRTSATFSFSSCNSKNGLDVKKIEYKLHTASTWTSGVATATSGTGYTIGGGNIDITKSYDVRCTVTDKLSNTTTYVILVPPIVGFAIGLNNDRARFGGPVEKTGLQVDWPAEFNSTVDITPRRCYASLSSAGWYRVLEGSATSQTTATGAQGQYIKFNIQKASSSENHSIELRFTSASGIVFVNERSRSNTQHIDKIRYTYNTTTYNWYVDIHFTDTSAHNVGVDFTVHTATVTFQPSIASAGLTAVADTPSGETIVTEYTFNANGTGDLNVNGTVTGQGFADLLFGYGNGIASNTNCDTLTAEGKYTCPSTTVGSTLTNPPYTSAFGMFVFRVAEAQRLVQIAMPNTTTITIKTRYYNGSTWTAWKTLTPS